MRVRLDERGQQHLAGQVGVSFAARAGRGDNARDQSAGQFDVDQFSGAGPR